MLLHCLQFKQTGRDFPELAPVLDALRDAEHTAETAINTAAASAGDTDAAETAIDTATAAAGDTAATETAIDDTDSLANGWQDLLRAEQTQDAKRQKDDDAEDDDSPSHQPSTPPRHDIPSPKSPWTPETMQPNESDAECLLVSESCNCSECKAKKLIGSTVTIPHDDNSDVADQVMPARASRGQQRQETADATGQGRISHKRGAKAKGKAKGSAGSILRRPAATKTKKKMKIKKTPTAEKEPPAKAKRAREGYRIQMPLTLTTRKSTAKRSGETYILDKAKVYIAPMNDKISVNHKVSVCNLFVWY
jgi:hypothetical protein